MTDDQNICTVKIVEDIEKKSKNQSYTETAEMLRVIGILLMIDGYQRIIENGYYGILVLFLGISVYLIKVLLKHKKII